jgi:hypothetical protein
VVGSSDRGKTSGSINYGTISRLAEGQLVSEEGLCSMELVDSV